MVKNTNLSSPESQTQERVAQPYDVTSPDQSKSPFQTLKSVEIHIKKTHLNYEMNY